MFKYELHRAFNHQFIISLLLGILCGIGGLIAYSFDTQFTPTEFISCYDAWLYCNSVAESSFYKALLPIIICFPYLSTFYTDRKTAFIYMVLSRTTYKKYMITKVLVGIISTGVLVLTIPFIWLALSFALFPSNLPTSDVSLYITGIFSQYHSTNPLIYITILIALSLSFAVVFFIFSFALSYFAKNKKQVIILPFVAYIFFILFSQFTNLPYFCPTAFYLPYEAQKMTFFEIIISTITLLSISNLAIYFQYRRECKEML